ncbi:MAG: histidine kinase N-terminal 7TM domain-containing protein, partial [Chloroflexota bacterium]
MSENLLLLSSGQLADNHRQYYFACGDIVNWQFTPYLLLPLMAAILLGALAFFGWRRRPAPGASAFALLMLSVAEWSLGNALELGTADLPGKIFWLNIEYIGIVAL